MIVESARTEKKENLDVVKEKKMLYWMNDKYS